ncbi:MAG: Fic family protein [Patescibacteria group bacterium]
MIKRPPNWLKNFSGELFKKAISSTELRALIKQAEKDYVYWDTFKHYKMPDGFTPEEAWTYLKFSRNSNSETTPVKANDDKFFGFTITKNMHKKLSFIDSNTSGFLISDADKPSNSQRGKLIISGFTEEAIASSQIEGANTSRRVAKEMLLTNRKARTRDEQMIINNYQVMQRLLDWKDLELTKDMLIEIQKNITTGTLDNEADSGRFRTDEDDIGVVSRLTGETVFTPPKADFVSTELEKMVVYANSSESEDEFVYPVIKASILHFWLAYLHPFVDGNGRTARAIFYWYMLRNNYWMFQYLSVSRIIKRSKTQYDNSYLHSEYDDNDMTYFLNYKLQAITLSIKEFVNHYQQKLEKDKVIQKIAGKLGEFNGRQIDLLQDMDTNKDKVVDIASYKANYRISYETARSDLGFLVEKNLLDRVLSGKKFIYIPNTVEVRKLLETAPSEAKN